MGKKERIFLKNFLFQFRLWEIEAPKKLQFNSKVLSYKVLWTISTRFTFQGNILERKQDRGGEIAQWKSRHAKIQRPEGPRFKSCLFYFQEKLRRLYPVLIQVPSRHSWLCIVNAVTQLSRQNADSRWRASKNLLNFWSLYI